MSRLQVRVTTMARALASLIGPRRRAGSPVDRILVAHNLLLGDTLLLAPLLKALATRYPDAERVVLARPEITGLFSGRPYGTTVLRYDRRDRASHRAVIDSGPYDLALVPDDNRYAWLARAAGARRVVGFAADRPGWKNAMLDRAVPYPDEPGAWADIVAVALADDGIGHVPTPYVVGEWPAPVHAHFDRPDRPYVVLHVGASTPLKAWVPGRWRTLADRCEHDGWAIVWSGGAGERGSIAAIGLRDGEYDLVGKLDLPRLWHLLAGAGRLFCPDTGVAHLARLVGVPTVALFGPGSDVVHGKGRFWADSPFETITTDPFPCRDQRVLYRRDVAWVRRCGRRFDEAAAPAGRSDPGACGRALCMQSIATDAVIDLLSTPPVSAPRDPSRWS